MSYSPYQPPQYQPPPFPVDPRFGANPSGPLPLPTVFPWYVAYCVFMALLYFCCLAGGGLLVVFADEIHDKDFGPLEARIMGIVFAVISLPLLGLYVCGPLLPRTKLGWIIGCVNIGIGLTSGCTMIPCIFLLIGWLHQETKLYYGMRP